MLNYNTTSHFVTFWKDQHPNQHVLIIKWFLSCSYRSISHEQASETTLTYRDNWHVLFLICVQEKGENSEADDPAFTFRQAARISVNW